MPESLFFTATAEDFKKIPGSPVAYWVSENIYNIFSSNLIFKNISKGSTGLQTSNSSIFIRLWHEISTKKLHYEWKLFAKGEDLENGMEMLSMSSDGENMLNL